MERQKDENVDAVAKDATKSRVGLVARLMLAAGIAVAFFSIEISPVLSRSLEAEVKLKASVVKLNRTGIEAVEKGDKDTELSANRNGQIQETETENPEHDDDGDKQSSQAPTEAENAEVFGEKYPISPMTGATERVQHQDESYKQRNKTIVPSDKTDNNGREQFSSTTVNDAEEYVRWTNQTDADWTNLTKADKVELPPCTVAIENKADYHYEVIESTILRYPLPWSDLNCSTEQPIVFDVALAETHTFAHEKAGWIDYFEKNLKGTLRNRTDGTIIKFGSIVSYMDYPHSYSALIGVSCDSYNFRKWLRMSPWAFCVLHGTCLNCNESMMKQSCWINPMHKRCYYMTVDLPQFPASVFSKNGTDNALETRETKSIRICVSGANRRHETLAEVLSKLSLTEDVKVAVMNRSPDIPRPYLQRNVSGMVQMVRETAFLDFQRAISRCDLLLPLIDPEHNPGYFPSGLKKLSGSLPQAIAYRLPTVMHSELHAVYRDELTAMSLTYNDTETFTNALAEMLERIRTNTAGGPAAAKSQE